MITLIFMYAALAASFTISKIVLQYATPYFLVGFRMIFAGGLFLAFQYVWHKPDFFLRKEDLWLYAKVSLFYIYLAYIPEFWALQYISSSKETILFAITPFISAICAHYLVAETLTYKKIAGMIVGILGIVPILLLQDGVGKVSTELLNISLPEAVLFIAIVSGAYAWFPIKQLMNKGYTLPMINGVTMLVGGIGALLTSFIVEGVMTPHVSDVLPFLFWTALLIILTNGIFYHLYGWHLRFYSFTMISFAGSLTPIFGSFYGWLFLSEQMTWNHLASLALVVCGLCIFYRDELKVDRVNCED